MRKNTGTTIEVSLELRNKLTNYKQKLKFKRICEVIDIMIKLVSFEEIKTYLEKKK